MRYRAIYSKQIDDDGCYGISAKLEHWLPPPF
jgi:hypothetical protein